MFVQHVLFAARNQANCSLAYIDEVRDWMKNNMMPIIEPGTRMFEYAGKQMEKNAELKAYILDFVHKADYNITDVYTEREKVPIPDFVKTSIMEDKDIPEKTKEKCWQTMPLKDYALIFNTQLKTNVEKKITGCPTRSKAKEPNELLA